MRALATIAMATLTSVGPAGALVPLLMHCEGAVLAAPEAELGPYNVFTHGDGFISYDRHIADYQVEFVLEHCESRARMTAVFDLGAGWERYDTFRSRLDATFDAPEVYTMRNLAQMAREGGARRAMLGQVDFASCGCQWVATMWGH